MQIVAKLKQNNGVKNIRSISPRVILCKENFIIFHTILLFFLFFETNYIANTSFFTHIIFG